MKPCVREPLLEVGAVARGARAVEQPDEVLQQRVRAAKRNEHEAVVVLGELRAFEVFPEVADGLHALVVRRADGEAPLHLASEVAYRAARASQTIRKSSVCQPRRSVWKLTSLTVVSIRMGGIAADQELRQPVGADMLLEKRASTPGGRWT